MCGCYQIGKDQVGVGVQADSLGEEAGKSFISSKSGLPKGFEVVRKRQQCVAPVWEGGEVGTIEGDLKVFFSLAGGRTKAFIF